MRLKVCDSMTWGGGGGDWQHQLMAAALFFFDVLMSVNHLEVWDKLFFQPIVLHKTKLYC